MVVCDQIDQLLLLVTPDNTEDDVFRNVYREVCDIKEVEKEDRGLLYLSQTYKQYLLFNQNDLYAYIYLKSITKAGDDALAAKEEQRRLLLEKQRRRKAQQIKVIVVRNVVITVSMTSLLLDYFRLKLYKY